MWVLINQEQIDKFYAICIFKADIPPIDFNQHNYQKRGNTHFKLGKSQFLTI
jgi:hypothetical protein